jgi:GTPase-associated protein 1, N-terminal domain type 2
MPQVDTHLLASRDGYTTFAKSTSVTPPEQRELEELVYGQPDDAIVYAALTAQATAMLRRLRSTGRYALSRIIQGDRDSAGRETIAVCTIILTASQYQAIARGDLWRLLHSPQLWSVTLFRSGQPLALPEMLPVRRAITSSDVTLFDAWMAARSRQNAVAMIGANPASHQAIIALLQVLAEKDLLELTWGCRLFSLPSSISVASIAQRGVEQNSRRIIVTPATSPTTTYGQRSLALVGTNRYLTSVIEPVTIAAKAPQYSAEPISLVDDVPSRAPKRQRGKKSNYTAGTGSQSIREQFQDPLADLTPRKTVLFLFAGILALCVVVSAFWLIPQFQSSREVTAQKIIAQDAAKDAKSNKEKAVSAKTPEESKTFADDAEKSAVGSRTAADAAKKANENAGLFAVTSDATAAQDAANSARADADAAKNATDEMIAAKAAKAAADSAIAKAADDAKAADEKPTEVPSDPAQPTPAPSPSVLPDVPIAPPQTPPAVDPILPTAPKVAPKWNTELYIEQLSAGLRELGESSDVKITLKQVKLVATEIGQFKPEKINEAVFRNGDDEKKATYSRLLFVVKWISKVLESAEQKTKDSSTEMNNAWKLLTKVGPERPDAQVVHSIEKFINVTPAMIQDYAIGVMPSGPSDPKKMNAIVEEASSRLKENASKDRCTLKCGTISWLPIVGEISLDSRLNLEKSFQEMPFYSIVLVFHQPFDNWIAQRKRFVTLYDSELSKAFEKSKTAGDTIAMENIMKIRDDFPWEKIYTPLDSEIAALEACPIPQVASIAVSAQDLIKSCEAAKTVKKNKPSQ